MTVQSELKSSLYRFLNTGDMSTLEAIVDGHPELLSNKPGNYPDFHRIMDIRIGTKHYRLCRQISAGEELTLLPIDEALDTPGVPIWLEGEKLRKWAKIEEENPSDEPIDWDQHK